MEGESVKDGGMDRISQFFQLKHCVVVFMRTQQVVFVVGLFVMRFLGRVLEGEI